MARKRMFDSEIISQDDFLDLPKESIALYFLLGMEADDEGFVAPKKVMRVYGISEDSLKVLILKKFIIPFQSGVVVITDWKRNNWLDSRRIQETIYQDEKKQITINNDTKQYILINPTESKCLADAKQMLRENRVEENRIEQNRIEESSSSNININKNNNSELNENDSCVDDFYLDDGSDSCVDGFQKVIDFYNNNIGFITPYTMELLDDYAKEMTNDVVVYALQLSVEANCRNLNYIKAILNNWNKAGVKNLIQAQEENQIHKKPSTNLNETQEEKNARRAKEIKEAMKKNATR